MVRVAAALCSLAIVGCYSPSVAPCVYACAGTECPSGLTCNLSTKMCVENAGDSCNTPHEDGGPDDADIDASVLPDATTCGWPGLSNVDPCALGADTTTDTWVASGTVDTNTMVGFPADLHPVLVTMPGGTRAVAVPVAAFSTAAAAPLLVTGERPLIIVSRGMVTIGGRIDLSGTIDTPCGGVINGMSYVGNGSSGGGGGGGYGGPGGMGGTGNTDVTAASDSHEPAGTGGGRGPNVILDQIVPLRGGCPGGKGGAGMNGLAGGVGGSGGGGIQISSKTLISVANAIVTNGTGGLGTGVVHAGGGGGGSGGAILLEAPLIQYGTGAALCANGGGGGTGGTIGNTGFTSMLCESAAGGVGVAGSNETDPDNAGGGRGGFGMTIGERAGENGNSPRSKKDPAYGGGGGGGGAGKIRINSTEPPMGQVTASPIISSGPF